MDFLSHVCAVGKKCRVPAVLEPKLNGFGRSLWRRAAAGSPSPATPAGYLFHSGYLMNTQENRHGNLYYTYGISAIALLILLVAGFNFLNLATARSLRRAKRWVLRKVLGRHLGQVRRQFLAETFSLPALAFLVSLILLVVLRIAIAVLLGHSAGIWRQIFAGWVGFPIHYRVGGAGKPGFLSALVMSRYKAAATPERRFSEFRTGSRPADVAGWCSVAITTSTDHRALWPLPANGVYPAYARSGFRPGTGSGPAVYTPDFMQPRFEQARQVLAPIPGGGVTAGDVSTTIMARSYPPAKWRAEEAGYASSASTSIIAMCPGR